MTTLPCAIYKNVSPPSQYVYYFFEAKNADDWGYASTDRNRIPYIAAMLTPPQVCKRENNNCVNYTRMQLQIPIQSNLKNRKLFGIKNKDKEFMYVQ